MALMMHQKTNLSLEGLTVEYYGEGHEDCLDAIMKGKIPLDFFFFFLVQKAYYIMRGSDKCCSVLCIQRISLDLLMMKLTCQDGVSYIQYLPTYAFTGM